MASLTAIYAALRDQVAKQKFGPPVSFVYNPLDYAWKPHQAYLERYGRGRKRVVLMGMNPGPFGMAQTGVPFGAVSVVRDWMQIEDQIDGPAEQHPKRPILGFATTREEVSGTRLWQWAAQRYGSAEKFFADFLVLNYCPLVFMESSGKNRTPDKLPPAEKENLYRLCNKTLAEAVTILDPEWVVGIGKFAEARARDALRGFDLNIDTILHPSPASPAANRGWAPQAEEKLKKLKIL